MEARNDQEKVPDEAANISGLGHSTPLVSVPAAPVLSGVRPVLAQQVSSVSSVASSVVSATDHPLAILTNDSMVELPVVDTSVSQPARTTFRPPPPPPPLLTTATAPKSYPDASAPLPPAMSPAHVAASVTLDDLADKFLSSHSPRSDRGLPPLLHPDPLPSDATDLERLRLLVDRRAWADASLLTERLLRGTASDYALLYDALLKNCTATMQISDSYQADLVWIMTVQCHAWLKMKRYTDLELAVDSWSFCHHKDNTAPSWIPWSLHIMAASTLLYTADNSQDAMEALWALRADIPKDKEPVARLQVENALSNAFIRQKDWRMAISSQQRMLDVLPAACQWHAKKLLGTDDLPPANDGTAVTLERAYRSELLSWQGRALLQIGAIREAAEVFQMASTAWKENPPVEMGQASRDYMVELVPAQLSVNEGLLCFSYLRYGEAIEFFRKAVQHIRQTKALLASSEVDPQCTMLPTVLRFSAAHSLYSETINNMALCALYTCRLRESLLSLESLVREDPTRFLTERVALNLCTLYELSNEATVSGRKKRVLQQIAKRFFLHDIGQDSFRL